MSPAEQVADPSLEWREAQQLYSIYVALAREFVIEAPDCAALESQQAPPDDSAIRQARQWFTTMDRQIQVHQLRQFLQTTTLADTEKLRLLLLHHLRKEPHSSVDRDKVDFLLVQNFSYLAPPKIDDVECDLAYVAQALEPLVGPVNFNIPDWLAPLEPIIEAAAACRRLSELFGGRIVEQGRKLKAHAGENYFAPVALVAFARFNFLIRRIFFRLMHDDLNAILEGLTELDHRGVKHLDCRRAHFSHQEPTDRLRMICHSWKVMFQAEYSSGQPLKMLTDLRTVVEEALAKNAAGGNTGNKSSGKARVASAAAAAANSSAPEFQVASPHLKQEDD
ncbi:MAG TPA: hypothetical protein VFI95_13835 [Terriglobales bacterium]|nr:hypothetical protein [Terriglobales bacterium]